MAPMIDDLPLDLLSEIVCRVPLKDMRAVRLTCKKWDTLSKSWSFRKMHMCNEAAREEGESRMVALMNNNLHLISVVVDDVNHASTEIKAKLSRLDEEELVIRKVFHCKGLLLCVFKKSFRLMAWNPYLGQTRWIEPPSNSYHPPGCEGYMYRYGFGYDHKKQSHKILRFITHFVPKEGPFSCYEIYDFDSNLWRTIDAGTPHYIIRYSRIGVPLNGNTYWLADHYESTFVRLVCFDFTSEKFGPILPMPCPDEEEGREAAVDLSSLSQGDKLAILFQIERPYEVVLWVTTVIDPNHASWSKFLTVNTGPVVASRITFSNMGFFIDEEKKVAMVFDQGEHTRFAVIILGEAGFFREVDVDLLVDDYLARALDQDLDGVCSYVPSLVQIRKPPLRVYKRKQRSKLQLRPCQQNKSLDEKGESAKRARQT